MNPDPHIMIKNLDLIANIIGTISILFGLGLTLSGFFTLKRFAEMRSFMSQQMTLWWPIMKIMSGSMLLILPTFIKTALYTFWGSSSPLTYHATANGWDSYIPVVLTFVRLIGIGAIVRAIIMFSRTGISGSPPGILGKSVVFLFAGIMLMHVVGVYQLLRNILDLSI